MRTAFVFLGGLLLGGSLVGVGLHRATAQGAAPEIVGLNHVGVTAPDMERALAYYRDQLGFREAFRSVDDAGALRLVYLQISRDTFLELNRAEEGQTAGINHLGIHVEDAAEAVRHFRALGADVEDTRRGSTGSIITNIRGLEGVRIELTELPPDSEPRKAMDRWR